MSAKITSFLLLALIVGGCAPRAVPPTAASRVTERVVASSTPLLPSATSTTVRLPTPSVSATPTPQAVSVAAVKGNLFIRRGPDMAFNPVGVLYEGKAMQARGRDVLGEWLEIPLPNNSAQNGWVSIQTIYSAVNGDVAALPEIEPTDYPVPAFLRNCTFHDMTAEPGGILLPALNNFPANDVRINPGVYRVYDTDVEGYPEVLKVELREGSAIDVRVDGNGDSRKCPQP